MKKSSIFLTAFVMASALTVSLQAQTHTLRYTPKKGAHYDYSTGMSMQQSMSAMGQEISFDIGMNTDMMLDVTEAAKGVNTMNVRFKNANVKLTGMAGLGGNDTNMSLGTINNMKLDFTISDRGEIISSNKADLDGNEDPMMKQMSNSINQMTNIFTFEFPEKPLKKGDTWTVSKKDTNSGEGGSVITSSTTVYTFDGVVDTLGIRCARIQTKSTAMTMEGKIKQMGMDMAMEADGATAGTSYVELSNGMPVASRTTTQMDMRMAITGQENMIIPMQTDVRMTMTRVK